MVDEPKDPLGDGISRIELLDVMGDDLRCVNAARVSFDKWKEEFGEDDKKLLKYLATHGHWAPFAHPQLCFRITAPIFIAREWFRHQIGFARNEVSGRYVTEKKQFFVPKQWRMQAKNKKQGSSDDCIPSSNEFYIKAANRNIEHATELYHIMVEEGVAGEQARTVLPQSMYTKWIETGSLAAYARLCGLRVSPDAQLECQKFAEAVDEAIAPLFPVSWAVLRNKE